MEGDGRVGGGGAGDRGGEAAGRLFLRLDEGDAVLDEQLGQLDHRREEADAAETRVENHGRLVHRRTA